MIGTRMRVRSRALRVFGSMIRVAAIGLALLTGLFGAAAQEPDFLVPPLPSRSAPAPAHPSQAGPPSRRDRNSPPDRKALQKQELAAKRVLANQPDHEKAILALADVWLTQGRKQAAIALLRDKYQVFPHLLKLGLTLGRIYLEENDLPAAECYLRQVQLANPCFPDLHYWLANLRLRQQQPLGAWRLLQVNAPVSDDKAVYHQALVQGMCLAQVGLPRHALERWEWVRSQAPNSKLTEQAGKLQQELCQQRSSASRFSAQGNVVGRYDTNPGLVPTANVLGIANRPGASWVGQADGVIAYELVRRGNFTVSVADTILATRVFSASRFDLLDNVTSASASYRGMFGCEIPYQLTVQSEFDHLRVGGFDFLNRYGGGGSLTTMFTDWFSTTTVIRYAQLDYVRLGAFENTVLDADSDLYSAGATFTKKLRCADVTWQGGYFFNANQSQGGNVDFLGHQVQIGVAWLFPGSAWEFNLSGGVDWRNFQRADFFAGRQREDLEYRVSGIAVRPLAKRWSLRLGVSWNRNSSNIASSRFDRQTYEAGLQYRFSAGD